MECSWSKCYDLTEEFKGKHQNNEEVGPLKAVMKFQRNFWYCDCDFEKNILVLHKSFREDAWQKPLGSSCTVPVMCKKKNLVRGGTWNYRHCNLFLYWAKTLFRSQQKVAKITLNRDSYVEKKKPHEYVFFGCTSPGLKAIKPSDFLARARFGGTLVTVFFLMFPIPTSVLFFKLYPSKTTGV